jgi:hypothetical protein
MENNHFNHVKIINDTRLTIDVAVLYQETNEIRQMCNDHITNLDDICVTQDTFRNMFFPYSENFCIDANYIDSHEELKKKISFLPEYRSVNGKKFYLLEQILTNLETDLSVPRSCFTIDSRVELANQIARINTLCDLNANSVLSSLTWSNIVEIIKNYKLIKNKSTVVPVCVISVIIKTPTEGVENTIIRFNYKIVNME